MNLMLYLPGVVVMKFFDALTLEKKEVIALVGAGGKTSVMLAMAKEAEQQKRKTILTTTTKIFKPKDRNMKVIVSAEPDTLLEQINHAFVEHHVVVVAKRIVPGQPDKLDGFDDALIHVLQSTFTELILVEADGAAGRPFKAPAPHEPVIPVGTTLVIPIVGIDCIQKELNAKNVHRPEIIAKIAAIAMGEKITPAVVATVFTSVLGYRKGVPSEARWIPFINKIGTPMELSLAREIAAAIRTKIPATILIGTAQNESPVKEVIRR
jgi:probable selenium-dependent hydroxylase accessory protein YqeC